MTLRSALLVSSLTALVAFSDGYAPAHLRTADVNGDGVPDALELSSNLYPHLDSRRANNWYALHMSPSVTVACRAEIQTDGPYGGSCGRRSIELPMQVYGFDISSDGGVPVLRIDGCVDRNGFRTTGTFLVRDPYGRSGPGSFPTVEPEPARVATGEGLCAPGMETPLRGAR